MASYEVIISDWNKILELLKLLEDTLYSDQENKWVVADELASNLDCAFRAFFEVHQDIPDEARQKISTDGIKVMAIMAAIDSFAKDSKKQMKLSIGSFLSQQKGVRAYKKV